MNGDRGLVLSAEATRDFFTAYLGSHATPEHVDLPDLDPTDGGVVERDTYRGGAENNEVVFYRVNGAGHSPPSIAHPLGPGAELIFGKQNHDIETAVEIWSFLQGRQLAPTPLPASGSWGGPILVGLLLGMGLVGMARWRRQ